MGALRFVRESKDLIYIVSRCAYRPSFVSPSSLNPSGSTCVYEVSDQQASMVSSRVLNEEGLWGETAEQY